MFVPIQQFCYFLSERSDSIRSNIDYLYHRIIHMYIKDKIVLLTILLSYLMYLASPFMIVYKEGLSKSNVSFGKVLGYFI